MTTTTHDVDAGDPQPLLKRVASASAIGTAAEYYDFFAYGTAAVLFFGQLFFPSADRWSARWRPSPPTRSAFWRVRWAALSSAISAIRSAVKRRW
ncbi:Inner membrane metabolite transport protein yhjE [Serratia rubidaea]|uniref:Inner membrane metabolite transport protein yhjE n=1 Tax=Serratia rubidaea TaxID=61652 RepID=A0A4U9HQS1_SERRU|nr:Inner membrane metabolite transport protein yhjE [Serratia rubidaea]